MVITVNNIMVKVEGLSKEFRGEMILQDVNITLERGKIYGLVGMNGSGKTVFMKCLCGFLKPTTGKVTVDGKEVGKEIDFPQDLGLMITPRPPPGRNARRWKAAFQPARRSASAVCLQGALFRSTASGSGSSARRLPHPSRFPPGNRSLDFPLRPRRTSWSHRWPHNR